MGLGLYGLGFRDGTRMGQATVMRVVVGVGPVVACSAVAAFTSIQELADKKGSVISFLLVMGRLVIEQHGHAPVEAHVAVVRGVPRVAEGRILAHPSPRIVAVVAPGCFETLCVLRVAAATSALGVARRRCDLVGGDELPRGSCQVAQVVRSVVTHFPVVSPLAGWSFYVVFGAGPRLRVTGAQVANAD